MPRLDFVMLKVLSATGLLVALVAIAPLGGCGKDDKKVGDEITLVDPQPGEMPSTSDKKATDRPVANKATTVKGAQSTKAAADKKTAAASKRARPTRPGPTVVPKRDVARPGKSDKPSMDIGKPVAEKQPTPSPSPTTPAARAKPTRTAAPGLASPPALAKKVADKPAPPLAIERYLDTETVRDVIGERRMMPAGPLAGIAANQSYNSMYYAAPGKKAGFGAAVQVWQASNRKGVNDRFRRMRKQYPNAKDTTALDGAKAFFAYYGDIMMFTFMDYAKRVIISVSCGTGVCSTEKLFKLAQSARKAI